MSFSYAIGTLGQFSLSIDMLSAFFVLIIGLLVLCISIYAIGYMKELEGRYSMGSMGLLFNIFVLSMLLVVIAGNAVEFIMVWEVMSISSYALVVYENKRKDSVRAGLLYITMMHLGTAFLTLGFVILWSYTGSFDFSSFSSIQSLSPIPDMVRSVAFLLFFIGFGAKAGLVPMHVWLPEAHPAAPSHISALMSGAMVSTAVYMMIRCSFDFLGPIDAWWGLLVLSFGCISAVVGVLYAIMQTDIKRALAFSTVDNMGIVFIGLGVAMVFWANYIIDPVNNSILAELAALALIATLFHVLAHALFKGLLFMGAGAITYSTHTRNMEELGGLVKTMKWTSILFFIGVLCISAIPPLCGFVGEWLMFQSLFLTQNLNDPMINLLIPVAVGILALTGALTAACFVRIFGITFLARPRTDHAKNAKEVPRTMLIGMSLMAALCIILGLASVLVIQVIDQVTSSILGISIASKIVNGLIINTPTGSFSSMSPLVIAALLLLIIPLTFVVVRKIGGKQKTRAADTWDCGTALGPRNEYTASGYSQPLNRVFRVLYRPRTEIDVESDAPLIKRKISYSTSIGPIFEKYLYDPIRIGIVWTAKKFSYIQRGSIQAYLAYIFVLLLILLLVFR